MHVLPHKPVSGDAVGEDRVDCRRLDACPYDRTGNYAYAALESEIRIKAIEIGAMDGPNGGVG
jgi:hypothetical protein